MARPKPIEVKGESCGHVEHRWKDAIANTGGTRYSAIEKATDKAKKLCPAGIDSYTIASEGTGAMTTIRDSDSHYEMNENIMDNNAGISGDRCYKVKLSVFCRELPAMKQVLSTPSPAPVTSTPSSTSIPHERNAVELPRGTHPIKAPQKGAN